MTSKPQLHLGDLFRSRRDPGRAGLPVTAVTMYGGLVQRDTLEGELAAVQKELAGHLKELGL
jgi:hypothetical protein